MMRILSALLFLALVSVNAAYLLSVYFNSRFKEVETKKDLIKAILTPFYFWLKDINRFWRNLK